MSVAKSLALLVAAVVAAGTFAPAAVELPRAVDERLKVELFAAEPDIVTPIGLAVLGDGRLLVVESHTHFRPANYQGPPADRLRLLADTDGDGRADAITTYFEGTQATMNVALHPSGDVYVATRMEVFRLGDRDGDGTADERTPICHLETAGDYPHNGLAGLAFDFAGNLYVSQGENLGASFKLVGSDGSSFAGAEGGHIFRCDAEGRHVERIATGFWNPFALAMDQFGRLFAVDNDPDSSPPCRLLHIVPGGNYGYKYRNGRRGLHPFTAWNGELPGTLPMMAGTGEAPSGIVAYELDRDGVGLPEEYAGCLLVTSWGEHRLERHRPVPRGASFQSVPDPFVVGGENFRPVGIAIGADGSLLVSDWADKSYEVHGKGRIWRITSKATDRQIPVSLFPHFSPVRAAREEAARRAVARGEGRERILYDAVRSGGPAVQATALAALCTTDHDREFLREVLHSTASSGARGLILRSAPPGTMNLTDDCSAGELLELQAEAMRRFAGSADSRALWKAVESSDPFLQQAARQGLRHAGLVNRDVDYSQLGAPQRLAALLVLRDLYETSPPPSLVAFLRDPDADVRRVAVQWVGEERLAALREALPDVLSAGPVDGRLFAAYLAALEKLDGAPRSPDNEWSPAEYVARALDDPRVPRHLHRWALRMLPPTHPSLTLERLQGYFHSDDPALRMETVRTFRESQHAERGRLLAWLASDGSLPADLRAEAIVGLSSADPDERQALLQLAGSPLPAVRNEALRSLRGAELNVEARAMLARIAAGDPAALDLVQRVLSTTSPAGLPRADDTEAWLELLAGPADAAAGERIFFHARSAGCYRCHTIDGRGGRAGPELTTTGRLLDRRRLVESILQPGKEIAPRFVTWLVVKHDGTTFTGALVGETSGVGQTYANDKGELEFIPADQIDERRPLATSIMPERIYEQLTVQEFRDLLAFVSAPRD